jgi:23S rRNA pseudouridine1911/1915/1917 synthase
MSDQQVNRECVVPAGLAGQRADRTAAELLPEFSRAQLTRWLRSGALTFDGRSLAPKFKLFGGEMLRLQASLDVDRGLEAQSVAFGVCYEDDDLLVVNKPAGVVVHPGAGNPDRTLVNGLIAHRPALKVLPRAGLIHRLDKGTSGLLIAACNERSFKVLTEAMRDRVIVRRYRAVVEGQMTGGREIEAPIGRDPRNRLKQRVRDDGRYALTRVRLTERFRAHTFIEAQLATGRTHQIRVHLSSIGYPLLGDRTYGARGMLPPRPTQDLVALLRGFGRPALHAYCLELRHPGDSRRLQFVADVPTDFEVLLDNLRRDRETPP